MSTSPRDTSLPIHQVSPIVDGTLSAPQVSEILQTVDDYGAVLVRSVAGSAEAVARFVEAFGGTTVDCHERFAPQDRVTKGIGATPKLFTPPAWPAGDLMCAHHDRSYLDSPPDLLVLACVSPPASGGETGIADGRVVVDLLPRNLRQRFEACGWTLRRTFRHDGGITWQEAFGTDSPALLARYAAEHDIEMSWHGDELHTRQTRQALHQHAAGTVWANDVAFFSRWTLDDDIRDYLLAVYGEDLPFDVTFGDGAPVDADCVAEIQDCYRKATLMHQWRTGDVLVIDNRRVAHTREPYTGVPTILTASLRTHASSVGSNRPSKRVFNHVQTNL